MIIGYARVSTQDQNKNLQLDALAAAGCEEVFHEKATRKFRDRIVSNQDVRKAAAMLADPEICLGGIVEKYPNSS